MGIYILQNGGKLFSFVQSKHKKYETEKITSSYDAGFGLCRM